MANICWNKLTVLGTDVTPFVEQAEGMEATFVPSAQERRVNRLVYGKEDPDSTRSRTLCFHRLCPVPADVLAAGYSNAGMDWQYDHWGCKWEPKLSERIVSPHAALYEFETANGPPLQLLDHVAVTFPDLLFFLSYGLEDPARGRAVWAQGSRNKYANGEPEKYKGRSVVKKWMMEHVATHETWVQAMYAAPKPSRSGP